MLGLDVIGADAALGLSWGDVGDVGKAAFPYVHATGKGIATAFGAGQAAQALENVEQKQGWLPPATADTASITATSQTVATAATPKLRAAAAKKAPPAVTPAAKPTAALPATKPATPQSQQPAQLSRTVVIAGTIGILGAAALLIRHLWSAN